MKLHKYLWLTLAIISVGMLTVFTAAGILFNRTLNEVQHFSQKRMLTVAELSESYVQKTSHSDNSEVQDSCGKQMSDWLAMLSKNSGFERIVITDSVHRVQWSSDPLIQQHDDFSPYLIDDESFYASVVDQEYRFSKTVKLEGVYFKSLYYPTRIDRSLSIIIIEADHNYFHHAHQFGRSVSLLGGCILIITGLIFFLLSSLNKKAQRAIQQASQNERLAYLGQTSAELAHELKNPLAIIKSSVDVLKMKFDPQGKEKAFTFISEDLMRISNLITDILSFSKDKQLANQLFSPKEPLLEVIKHISQAYPNFSIVNTLPDSLYIRGDTHAFAQIAQNILANACRAIKKEGTLSIEFEEEKESLILLFKDNGPGIEPSLAKSIFDPFVTGSKTGTGLGLAIVKSLCESMGWDITLRSYTSAQTCFAIYIKEYQWETS